MNGKAMLGSWLGALLTVLWTGLSPGQSGPPVTGRRTGKRLRRPMLMPAGGNASSGN